MLLTFLYFNKNTDQFECGDPEVPANGQVTIQQYESYHVARYSCNEGFHLSVNNPQRLCYGRQWVGIQPTCIPLVRKMAINESTP